MSVVRKADTKGGITFHSINGVQLLVLTFDTCFWNNTPHSIVAEHINLEWVSG